MAKRKKLKVRFKKKSSLRRQKERKENMMAIVKSLAVLLAATALVIGFLFLNKYVEEKVPVHKTVGSLVFVDMPKWVNDQLTDRIVAAAAQEEDFKLDDDAARSVSQNMEAMAWMHDVKVQVTSKNFEVAAKYRKPVALVKAGVNKFYLDKDRVVLDFVEIGSLPIVRIEGLGAFRLPVAGSMWEREDVGAALAVIGKLAAMDAKVTPDKPLLFEIETVDVSNFNGKRNVKNPHITLYGTDRTQIIWGAEVGAWQRYLEPPDDEKVAKLYEHYKNYGTLLNNVKYIELRMPQGNKVPQPIDKF